MRMINRLKRQIAIKMNAKRRDSRINKSLRMLNIFFFHRNDRKRMVHPGNEDPEMTYNVIRPSSTSEGLLSSYFTVADNIFRANSKGYISFVDFECEKCQYYTGREIYGTTNPWEYFFCQPSSIRKKDLARKKNVLYNGASLRQEKNHQEGIEKSVQAIREKKYETLFRLIPVRPEIKAEADIIYHSVFCGKKTLGVFIRGTDYVSLRPHGHPIQPTIEMVIEKINEFLEKHKIDQIYVVTEDYHYYTCIKNMYGETVFSTDDDFVKTYKEGTYISDSIISDPFQKGKNYLIRLLLLARCEYLISSITNGSLFAYSTSEKEYEDSYWFDLGVYE